MLLTVLLAKCLPKLFDPPVIQKLVSKAGVQGRLSYQAIAKRAQEDAARLATFCWALMIVAVVGVAGMA
jgi:hypothetical protein